MAMRSFLWVRSIFDKYQHYCLRFLSNTNKKKDSSPSTTHAITCSSPVDVQIFPNNVIAKIFKNLCVRDMARMRVVCRQWRSVLSRQEPVPTAQEPPWLILSDDSFHNPETFLTKIRFKNLSNQQVYCFEFPKLRTLGYGGCVCGYSGGWLLIAVDLDLFLWNPLSGVTYKLPPLSTLPFFDPSTLPFFDRFVNSCRRLYIIKNISSLILRVQVYKVESCIVVAVIFRNPTGGMDDELALCTPHEETWRVFRGEKSQIYGDILFHQGKLYALANNNDNLLSHNPISIQKTNYTIHMTKCQLEVHMLHLEYEGPTNCESVARPGFGISKSGAMVERLVESSTTGELLLVTTLFDHCAYLNWRQGPIGSFQCTQTREFQIRRLTIGDCMRLERLNSIGEQAIFVGPTSSFSLPAAAINGVFETDRIYFATDNAEGLIWKDEIYLYQEEDDTYDVADEDMMFVAREQGSFIVQENRIVRTCLTNVVFPSSSTIGYFMPKLF